MKRIRTNLKELGFADNEISVYLALTQLGEARASEVAKKCDLPRTTVISILERLANDNFVTTHTYRGTIYYWIESPNTITEIFENKVKIAKELHEILGDLYRADANFPTAQVCDTKNSIKGLTQKLLTKLEKNCTIYTIDAPHMGNYQNILSSDYNDFLLDLKTKRGILTQTLVPYGSYKLVDEDKIKTQNIIIKEMPEGIDFPASIWFMGKGMILFSGKAPFIVSIQHDMIVKSLKSVYDFLWTISELKHEPKIK